MHLRAFVRLFYRRPLAACQGHPNLDIGVEVAAVFRQNSKSESSAPNAFGNISFNATVKKHATKIDKLINNLNVMFVDQECDGNLGLNIFSPTRPFFPEPYDQGPRLGEKANRCHQRCRNI